MSYWSYISPFSSLYMPLGYIYQVLYLSIFTLSISLKGIYLPYK
ncbi:hypothetical protein AMTRI_Chr08g206580 [Amborella trichopoda]